MRTNNNKPKNFSSESKSVWPILFFCLLLFCIAPTGCKKFVQVDPPKTAITAATVYDNDLSAASAVTSIYIRMGSSSSLTQGASSISFLTGLTADELKLYQTSAPLLNSCYTNGLLSSITYFWNEIYQELHVTNSILEGLAGSTGVTQEEKNQLIGEAKFMRAFFHFYATNLFGDVPLVLTSDYHIVSTIHRSTQADVYQQIISDLKDAQQLLSDDYLTPTGGTITSERVRPNKGTATALLARVYLYNNNWDSAAMEATNIINNSATYSLTSLDNVFLKNSSEAIWQLQPVVTGENTYDADYFILYTNPGSSSVPVAMSTNLYNSFEVGDNRFTHWIGTRLSGSQTYHYPYKYKLSRKVSSTNPLNEYLMVFRLAEQYLIRAEARAQKGDLAGAAQDLNVIRARAGLSATTAATQADLLTAIYRERQVELFTEWGHRWFDLKRTDNLNSVMSVVTPQKGGTAWDSHSALFPIPMNEITLDPNLTQNPGY